MRRRRSVTVQLHQFAREVFTDAWLSSKQREPARYRLRAPLALDVRADGLVSKTDREGASLSGPANFLGRLSRSSDGAWLKPTRARSKTASLHQISCRKRRVRRRSHEPALFRAVRNPAP